jgi:hypothetical protein
MVLVGLHIQKVMKDNMLKETLKVKQQLGEHLKQ